MRTYVSVHSAVSMDGDSGDGSRIESRNMLSAQPKKLALGAWILTSAGVFQVPRIRYILVGIINHSLIIILFLFCYSYRVHVLILTFVIYAAYHMSRKPFSVVAVSLQSFASVYARTMICAGERSPG